MPEAVIVDAVRTPIGRAVKGSLKSVRADDLVAVPLKALIERNPEVETGSIVDVMMGCGFSEGESGYNIGRNATLLSGIDHHVPGTTVNRFCASSLQTTRMAFHAIKAGEGDTYIAAGVEAVSRAGKGADFQFHPQLDGSENSVYNVYIPMGLTAENVADRCKVSRQAQDEWAVTSQNRAVDAQESGHFDKEIVGVTAPAHTVTGAGSGASMVVVGAPEKPNEVASFALILGRRSLAGSAIGGIEETQEMLDFCGKHNVTSDIELIPIQKVNEAYERVLKSDVRYRFVIDMASLNAN